MKNDPIPHLLGSSGLVDLKKVTPPSIPSFDYVVIGGTGDLTFRKLLPALYYNHRRGLIDGHSRIIAAARSHMSTEEYHARITQALSEHLPPGDIDATALSAFLQKSLTYRLMRRKMTGGTPCVPYWMQTITRYGFFYLATAPHLFGPICHHLRAAGLINDRSRVVLEKPLGHDVTSALAINRDVGSVFSERNIFRLIIISAKNPSKIF